MFTLMLYVFDKYSTIEAIIQFIFQIKLIGN
jgi:hypothetical protein